MKIKKGFLIYFFILIFALISCQTTNKEGVQTQNNQLKNEQRAFVRLKIEPEINNCIIETNFGQRLVYSGAEQTIEFNGLFPGINITILPPPNSIYKPTNIYIPRAQYSSTIPIIVKLEKRKTIRVKVIPENETSLMLQFNNIPAGISGQYFGPEYHYDIETIKFPIDIKIEVPESNERYKTTYARLENLDSDGQLVVINLKKKLRVSTQRVIEMFVTMFNSAYKYYQTKNIREFQDIRFGDFYLLTEAFSELPELDADEQMRIIELIDKKIELPENTVISIIRSGVNIFKNFYIQKKKKTLTIEEENKLKADITNSLMDLWWQIYNLIDRKKISN